LQGFTLKKFLFFCFFLQNKSQVVIIVRFTVFRSFIDNSLSLSGNRYNFKKMIGLGSFAPTLGQVVFRLKRIVLLVYSLSPTW